MTATNGTVKSVTATGSAENTDYYKLWNVVIEADTANLTVTLNLLDAAAQDENGIDSEPADFDIDFVATPPALASLEPATHV